MPNDCLKLSCVHGTFTVLLNQDHVQVVYTDYGGTSRTSTCKPMDMLAFAMGVIDFYSPSGTMRVRVGGGD